MKYAFFYSGKLLREEKTHRSRNFWQGVFGTISLTQVINKKTQQQLALKEVVQDSKYKNR